MNQITFRILQCASPRLTPRPLKRRNTPGHAQSLTGHFAGCRRGEKNRDLGQVCHVAGKLFGKAVPKATRPSSAVMFTRALAIEGKRNGIRANVLTPSIVGGT